MEKFLTNFYSESSYDSFIHSAECPYVNVSYISETGEVKYYDVTTDDINQPFEVYKITDEIRIDYERWRESENRWLAHSAKEGIQQHVQENFTDLGSDYVLYIYGPAGLLATIDGTEWQLGTGWNGECYYSSTTVNGEPVAAIYNGDSGNPDFYVYNTDILKPGATWQYGLPYGGTVTRMYVLWNNGSNDHLFNIGFMGTGINPSNYPITIKYRLVDRTGTDPVYGEWASMDAYITNGYIAFDFPFVLEPEHSVQLICKSVGLASIFNPWEDPSNMIKYSGNYMSVIWGDMFPYASLKQLPFSRTEGPIFDSNTLFNKVVDASHLILPTVGISKDEVDNYYEERWANQWYQYFKVPIIKTNYIPDSFFNNTFRYTNIQSVPKIDVETVSQGNTFNGMCSLNISLTNVNPVTGNSPEVDWLGIKNVKYEWSNEGCFYQCFKDCVNLRYAPPMHLESVEHDNWLFYETFSNCQSLIECDWVIPYNNSADGEPVFGRMFENCWHLTSGPTITGYCTEHRDFGSMFYGCTSLAELKFPAMVGTFEFSTSNFAPTGTIYVNDDSVYLDSTSEYYGQSPISGWTVEAWSNYPSN